MSQRGPGAWAICGAGAAACLLVMLGALVAGPERIPAGEAMRILVDQAGRAMGAGGLDGTSWAPSDVAIIWHVRAPRVLSAALAGAALAFAGVIMQGLFRNPLASPDVLGASSGASLGAVLCIAAGWAARSIWPVPVCAFVGALAVVTLVYALASNHGDTPLATLLLSGVAVSAFTGAMTSLVLSLAASHSWEAAREIVLWTMGGLDARQWKHVLAAAPPVALSVAGGLLFSRDLNIMLLGEEQARTLGVDTRRLKVCVLASASLATGAAVAIGGLIAFVGLIVPHLLRLVLGPDHRRLGPACIFGGAAFLVVMDTVARTIGPSEIRLGILTGALGAPFFLFLLASQRNKALHL